MNSIQKHLNKEESINLGSFYTPLNLVNIAYDLIERLNLKLDEYIFLDSSCGYGDFFIKNYTYIGTDIDEKALTRVKNAKIFHTNSLLNVSRTKFKISQSQRLIIIGNPPYNDTTSLARQNLKNKIMICDKDLKYRDLGISFLRSYAKLKADFVCVLHPLSYLIKKTNFNALNDFRKKYKLIDEVVISSQFFTPNSSTFFPIIIALYEKNKQGMTYDFIQNYKFKTLENTSFSLKNFDFISNYICKYPNLKDKRKAVAYFHTLRDINALKRNKSFLQKQSSNSIKVFKENLKYYVYVHLFKQYASKLPYYFGNLDIFIDNASFLKIAGEFEKYFYKQDFNQGAIDDYFIKLFARYKVKIDDL
ncbi:MULTISPECIES: Eco57I restriction-modification methylase domain-containing protein [unclassified Campylobacter]|uniref:Eco57I restriction-modification methylase domain-containing protein n=1 Tax=unclassified Campylobacter TaxID=2593542 RepID=UPI001680752F|nr:MULTISPECIES: Eco57I restriction-modification methylase domain-containing protein [unclassified Campylobacter]